MVIMASGFARGRVLTTTTTTASRNMAAILRGSTVVVVVVVRKRPRAIPLAMITMKKSTHGFPFVSHMSMGLRLADLAAGAPL